MNDGRGRPPVETEQKVVKGNGLFTRQWERVKFEAARRGLTGAQFLRQIVDWYFTEFDRARAINEANKALETLYQTKEKSNE